MTTKRSAKRSATQPVQLRQGDVFLIRVDSGPDGDRRVIARDQDRVVLAYGEVTGHAHAIADKAVVHYNAPNPTDAARQLLASVGLRVEVGPENAPTFLDVQETATLAHEEHGAATLEPGHYVVLRQREWSDSDEPIQVAD